LSYVHVWRATPVGRATFVSVSGPVRPQGKDGKPKLLTANAGDARIILSRGGKAIQLTEDHVPDS
jgi:serine/threonine protein phosphatase PrpC